MKKHILGMLMSCVIASVFTFNACSSLTGNSDSQQSESSEIENSMVELPIEQPENAYLIETNNLTYDSIVQAYQSAVSLTEAEVEGKDCVVIDLADGALFLNQTLKFPKVTRAHTLPIYFYGPNTKVYGGEKIEKGGFIEYLNGIYKKEIPAYEQVRTLIINGKNATLAKTKTTTGEYDNASKQMRLNKKKMDVELSGSMEIRMQEKWGEDIGIVASITDMDRYYGLSLEIESEKLFFEDISNHRLETPYITLVNNLGFLDEGGEFYYNPITSNLYYMPLEGENVQDLDIVVPTVETLLDTTDMVENVIFKGVEFNGTSYAETAQYGYHEIQGTIHQVYQDGEYKTKLLPGMIEIGSNNLTFERCKIKNAATTSIRIDEEVENIVFLSNEILESGAAGFYVGNDIKYIDTTSGKTLQSTEMPKNITICNNLIQGFGRVYGGAPGVIATYVDTLNILNNEICDGKYSGISVGWGWTNNENCAHQKYVINYNKVYNVMNDKLYDGACIYTVGNFSNPDGVFYNEIAYNYVEHVAGYGAIYLDEGSTSWNVHHNAIKVNNGAIPFHGGIFLHDTRYNAKNCMRDIKVTENYCVGDDCILFEIVPATGDPIKEEIIAEVWTSTRNIYIEPYTENDGEYGNEVIFNSAGRKQTTLNIE